MLYISLQFITLATSQASTDLLSVTRRLHISEIIHTIVLCLASLLPSFWDYSMSSCMYQLLYSFWWLCSFLKNIPHIVYSFVHHLGFQFWLLWINLLWTTCSRLCGHRFVYKYLQVNFFDHHISYMFTFMANVFHNGCTTVHSHLWSMIVPVVPNT